MGQSVVAAAAVVALLGFGHVVKAERTPVTVASGSLRSMDDSAAQQQIDAAARQAANDSQQAADET